MVLLELPGIGDRCITAGKRPMARLASDCRLRDVLRRGGFGPDRFG